MAKHNYSLANSLQKFTGSKDENLEFFINNLEQIADIEKWDDKKKALILKLNLSGNALKVVSETRVAEDKEFEEIVKLLRQKFSKKLNYSEIQNKFNALTQGPNQSIKSLIEDVDRVTKEYLEINNDSNEQTLKIAAKMKSQKLIDSMRPDIRLEVMKRGETEFDKIAEIAINVENALNNTQHCVNNLAKSSEIELLLRNQIESNKKIEELTEKLDSLTKMKTVNNVSQSNTVNKAQYTCHICFKGHITTDCWYYPNQSNPNQSKFSNQRFQPYERDNRNKNFRRGSGRRRNFRQGNRGQNHLN